MGIGGIGIWQLLIVLVIVLLLFGTKRLKGLGGDLGSAIKGFKKAMDDKDGNSANAEEEEAELKKVAEEESETAAKKEESTHSETKS